MSLGIKCYSQWFPGERNQVSDALSRDDDRSDEELTSVIKSFCPLRVPSHFKILQLPNEIISWLTALLLKNFTREHKHIIIGVFTMAVREARFSRASHERLAAGTVKDTVQYVCATF